jgi:outer membrane protein assembly factor BamB
VLVYLSCHGLLDDRGRLFYATIDTDTERGLLPATAVPAQWLDDQLNDQLDDCRARQQILLLDCCHSGALAKGSKGDDALALRDRFSGRGKMVLSASRATECSFEGAAVTGEGVRSIFTSAVVDGLRSGEADRDKDGLVSVEDLYHYVYDVVRVAESRQTPELWTFGKEGDLIVARSPRGPVIEPAPLPEDLRLTLGNSQPVVRESGVRVLADLADHGEPGVALTARLVLQKISEEDLPHIAALARAAHDAAPGQAVTQLQAKEQAQRQAKEEAARRQEAKRAAAQRRRRAMRAIPRHQVIIGAMIATIAAITIAIVIVWGPGAVPPSAVRWANDTAGTGSGTYPAPVGGAVYVGIVNTGPLLDNGDVYALDAATGNTRWTYRTDAPVRSSPVVAGGMVYVGTDRGTYALDAATGNERWTNTTYGGIPAVAGGIVYVADGTGVYALDAATGRHRWDYLYAQSLYHSSSLAVVGGTIYVLSTSGSVYALDAATGRELWTQTTESSEFLSGGMAVAGGTVYIGTRHGKVRAFAA